MPFAKTQFRDRHVCLGRPNNPTVDARSLKMAKYLDPSLPDPPAELSWLGDQTEWGMMLNGPGDPLAPDGLGDCTIAAPAHGMQVISKGVGAEFTIPDAEILKYYEWWDGYVNGDPSTDQGGDMLSVMNLWKNDKFVGHKLIAFVLPDLSDQRQIKLSVQLCGGVNIGLGLPITAQSQTDLWEVVGDPTAQNGPAYPGSWGGHDVWVAAYNAAGPIVITWGMVVQMTWNFWNTYVDEAYTPLIGYWFENGKSPSGFLSDVLDTDLVSLGQEPTGFKKAA